MIARVKEQTAFRFETELITQMKRRSKALGKSMNAYVTDLIEKDINDTYSLPIISLPEKFDEEVERLAGVVKCPSQEELSQDERLSRIWNR